MLASTCAVLAVLLASGVAWGRGMRLTRVHGDDMAPSLDHGDWVLTGRTNPQQGDVVRLPDPLDPEHLVLRRVLALPGQAIAFAGHQPRIDGQALKQVLMQELAGEMVLMEHSAWLLAVALDSTGFRTEAVEVPGDHLYLVADHRDVALDSRWWGAVQQTEIRDTVLLRIGPRDVWRAFVFGPRQTVRPEIPLMPYQVPEELRPPR